MATAIVEEFERLARDGDGALVPVGYQPSVERQVVTFTTSADSAPFDSRTSFIRVITDAKGHYRIGPSPVATASHPWVAADTPEYFGIKPGDKIAFYDGTS